MVLSLEDFADTMLEYVAHTWFEACRKGTAMQPWSVTLDEDQDATNFFQWGTGVSDADMSAVHQLIAYGIPCEYLVFFADIAYATQPFNSEGLEWTQGDMQKPENRDLISNALLVVIGQQNNGDPVGTHRVLPYDKSGLKVEYLLGDEAEIAESDLEDAILEGFRHTLLSRKTGSKFAEMDEHTFYAYSVFTTMETVAKIAPNGNCAIGQIHEEAGQKLADLMLKHTGHRPDVHRVSRGEEIDVLPGIRAKIPQPGDR